MEIRLQSRRSGITKWLVSEAIRHAERHYGSASYLVYPGMSQRDAVWDREFETLSKLGDVHEIGSSRSVELPNGSVIEFITTGYALASKRFTHYSRKYLFIDNIEMINPFSHRLENADPMLFEEVDDVFMGGTVIRRDGEQEQSFRVVLDYGEFARQHNMLDYIAEIDRIHDFIVDTCFLTKDAVQLRPIGECELCDGCRRKNDDCLRLGDFFAVNKKCPMYAELMVKSFNE